MKKNILVTGASGNMGNYVSPYLKKQGYKVTNFDKQPQKPDSANVQAEIPFVRGDLLSLGDCMRAIAHAQPDAIIHLGAIPFNSEVQSAYAKEYNWSNTGARFQQSLDEDETMQVNTMGTFYLMDAARRMGVKNIVAASSFYVLGLGFRISGTPFVPEYLPIDENHPCVPEDTYSLSKLLDEEIMKSFSRAYGMKSVALRLHGVFYPDLEWCQKSYEFGITVPEATEENRDSMLGTTYQYVDARDAARIIELAINADGLAPFETFYVATDTVYKEDTVEVIRKRWPSFLGKGKSIQGADGVISIEKAQKLLGYEPAYSWRNI